MTSFTEEAQQRIPFSLHVKPFVEADLLPFTQ
jgi:hypothetical protein